MLQNTSTIEYKHRKFVERIVEFEIVWALKSDEGFAMSSSNDFEHVDVILFWSDKAYAIAVAKNEWSNYHPVSMPISEFLENWLIGMHNDNHFAGTNWDANMFGTEIESLRLAVEVSEAIINKGKDLSFSKYKNISDYQRQIQQALT